MKQYKTTLVLDPASRLAKDGFWKTETVEMDGVQEHAVRTKHVPWLLKLGDVILRAGMAFPKGRPTLKCVSRICYGTLDFFQEKEDYRDLPEILSRPAVPGYWDYVWASRQRDRGEIGRGRITALEDLEDGDVVYTTASNLWSSLEVVNLPNYSKSIRPSRVLGFAPGDVQVFRQYEALTRARAEEDLKYRGLCLDKDQLDRLVEDCMETSESEVSVVMDTRKLCVHDLGTMEVSRSGRFLVGTSTGGMDLLYDTGRFADPICELLEL